MMKNADEIHMVPNDPAPSRPVSDGLHGPAGGWRVLECKFDGRDIDLLDEIIETLDWRNVTFGWTIEATIRCRDISDLVTLRLADRGTQGLKWHPADCAASCHPCLDPSGLMAFVDDFTPDATVDLAGHARIELADAAVLEQFVIACDARRDRFQDALPV